VVTEDVNLYIVCASFSIWVYQYCDQDTTWSLCMCTVSAMTGSGIPISQCTHVKLGYLTLDSQNRLCLDLQELGLLPTLTIEQSSRARMRHNSPARRPGSLYCILVHGLLSSSLPCIIVFDYYCIADQCRRCDHHAMQNKLYGNI